MQIIPKLKFPSQVILECDKLTFKIKVQKWVRLNHNLKYKLYESHKRVCKIKSNKNGHVYATSPKSYKAK